MVHICKLFFMFQHNVIWNGMIMDWAWFSWRSRHQTFLGGTNRGKENYSTSQLYQKGSHAKELYILNEKATADTLIKKKPSQDRYVW